MTAPQNIPPQSVFLRARLAGGRFDSHTLPLQVLPDLASYRRLIVEVAKFLFKETRGNRVRVPKGFEQSFELSISSVYGGASATVELVQPARYDKPQNQLFPRYGEFDEAREFVANLIRTVSKGEKVPDSFPPHLVGLFNPFGQSLRDDEFVELNSPESGVVHYSGSVRRAIVLSSEQIIESHVEDEFLLNGGVVDTGTIHVRDAQGRSLDFQPASQFEFEEAYRRAKGKVRLVGTGLYDKHGALRRLLAVNAEFDRPAFHVDLRFALDEAKRLSAGSDEIRNRQISLNLQVLQDHLEAYTDPNLEIGRPYVYVLEGGEISIEWTKDDWEANIEMSEDGAEYKIHALNVKTGDAYWSKITTSEQADVKRSFDSFVSKMISDSVDD